MDRRPSHRSHVSASRIVKSPIYQPLIESSFKRITRRLGFTAQPVERMERSVAR